MINRISYLLVVLIILAMTGCTIEQKLAKTFLNEEKPRHFYLLEPAYVFKYNLKEFEIPGIDTLADLTKDSLLMANSLLLKSISDSVILGEFISSFVTTLETYGAEVLPENAIDTLLENGGTPYIINIAQFSLEEYIHPFSSEEQYYDETIVIDGIDLNAINYNLWLELGRLNTEKGNKVLFTSDFLLDNINGTLKQNLVTGKISFDYTIDTISMPRVYAFARQFGELAAGYLFDYLMNSYIGENLPEAYPYERYYYHYDPVKRFVYSISSEEGFIELESK